MKAGESDIYFRASSVTVHGDTDTMIQAPSSYSWTVLPCPSLGEGGEYSKLSYDSRKLDSKSLQNHHPLESVSS